MASHMAAWLRPLQTFDSDDQTSILSDDEPPESTPLASDLDPIPASSTPSRSSKSSLAVRHPVWPYSRPPRSHEPLKTKAYQRIWYCKSCDNYNTPNVTNAEGHLRRFHGIIIERQDTLKSRSIRHMITQHKRRTSDSLDNEKFRNRMLSIVNKAAVNQALIELITRRNLP